MSGIGAFPVAEVEELEGGEPLLLVGAGVVVCLMARGVMTGGDPGAAVIRCPRNNTVAATASDG